MADFKQLYKQVKGKLHRKSLDVQLYGTYLKRKFFHKQAGANQAPAIWIDLAANSYVRYSYNLFKYFEIEGYQVYFKPNLKFMLSLGAPYARLLITENVAQFAETKPSQAIAAFSDQAAGRKNIKSISNDYFSKILNKAAGSYYIPIGMHPNMYKNGLWNAPLHNDRVLRSIFFAGNFNQNVYTKFTRNKKFQMIDRIEIGKLLKTLPNCTFPKSFDELIQNQQDGHIDIVQQANFAVPMEQLRPTIAKYSFFIACPGVDMPLSHNLIEAMSAAVIPIIHADYANMLSPALEHGINAVIYHNDNFLAKLQEALAITPEQITGMRAAVNEYYNQHFTPKGIVEKLLSPDYNQYYLNAERTSVGIMKVN